MTPQERDLVRELFDRLATLESGPRDPDAEGAIAEGLGRAPHATYALVQTVLVQDEALKRAHGRIEELEAPPVEEPPRSFLDNMRDSVFGREEPRGSVPRTGGLGSSGAWGQPGSPTAGGPPMGSPGMGGSPMGASPMGPAPVGTGGSSFLGTAAASAAGVIGGAMLLNGIRSMFGHSQGGSASAFDPGSAAAASPWGGGGSAANSDLSREAGIDNVGNERSGGDRFAARDDDNRTGLFGDDQDDDDDSRIGDDDDTDFAGDFDSGDMDEA